MLQRIKAVIKGKFIIDYVVVALQYLGGVEAFFFFTDHMLASSIPLSWIRLSGYVASSNAIGVNMCKLMFTPVWAAV